MPAVTRISSGSEFERRIGYSRVIVAGPWILVAGTTGYDYATMTLPEDVVEQCRNTLDNIARALAEAGATLDDVVRVTYILPKREDFEPCWPLLGAAFAKARPAATMYVADLMKPEMKIEIEVTAFRPEPRRGNAGDR